jgi:hypothetical protein
MGAQTHTPFMHASPAGQEPQSIMLPQLSMMSPHCKPAHGERGAQPPVPPPVLAEAVLVPAVTAPVPALEVTTPALALEVAAAAPPAPVRPEVVLPLSATMTVWPHAPTAARSGRYARKRCVIEPLYARSRRAGQASASLA